MAKEPKLDLRRIGSTGLPVWSGRIFDEVLPDLQGDRGRRILREMSEQDAIVGGTLFGIEMLSRQVPWSVTPADDTDEAKEVADFVDGALTDMYPTFGNTLSEILSMLIYGWSWLEILYKRREGLNPDDPLKNSRFDDSKIGWAGWSIRSQETLNEWMYEDNDPKNPLVGMIQLGPPDYKEYKIPRSKSLHFKTRSRRENPEGISILRNAYRSWYMKKNIEVIEGIGIERDLAGLPVLWAPAEYFADDASDDDKALLDHLQKLVTSIKRDEQEGILMPQEYDENKNPLYKLELLSTAGERQFDTNAIINRYDERIAMSMLADFILMGHQAVGSYALSTTKTGLFSTALSAIMDVIAEEINLVGIPKLVLLNGWSLKRVPSISHGKIEAADLGKLGEFLKQVYAAGMPLFPNKALEKHLLDLAGLPSDPGAGELPLPLLDDGTVDPAALATLPIPPGMLPPTITPAAPVALAKPTGVVKPKAASEEPKRSKHFTPLPQRVASLASRLEESLEPEEYRELLAATMAAKSFSRLDERYREAIREAELAE